MLCLFPLYYDIMTVFEVKVLFCAPAGCKDPQNGAPGHLFLCYPAAKLCTPVAGCTLNFEHCMLYTSVFFAWKASLNYLGFIDNCAFRMSDCRWWLSFFFFFSFIELLFILENFQLHS